MKKKTLLWIGIFSFILFLVVLFVWAAVIPRYPCVRCNAEPNCLFSDVEIFPSHYTCVNMNEDGSAENVSVQISRGSNAFDYELSDINLIISSEGNSKTFNVLNKTTTLHPENINKSYFLGANEGRVFVIDTSSLQGIPDSIRLSAVLKNGKKTRNCEASESVFLGPCVSSCASISYKNNEEIQECCNKEMAKYYPGCDDGEWIIWKNQCIWACPDKPLIIE